MSSVTTVIKGDIDGVNGVTITDAILAMQVMAGQTPVGVRTDYTASGADVDGNGKIGITEVIYILQYLSTHRSPGGT